MASIALVSILGSDRVGLVAAIADHLFDLGANLRDISFATLGSGAEFVSLCELPDDVTAPDVEAGLPALPELDGAQVRVVPYSFNPNPSPSGLVTHRITVSGGDQLGLVARLADVFRKYEANIVRLDARKLPDQEGGLYVTRFAVSIRPDQESACLATVTNTAGSLGLASEIERSRF